MLEKLKTHYLNLGPRRFVIGAVILQCILDVINTYFLKIYWLKKDLSTVMVQQAIIRNGETLESFSPDTIFEMKSFIDNTFYFFLFLIFINNIFFYFFYLRKKLWAQSYVLFYTLTAAIFAVSFILDPDDFGWAWAIYNFSTIFIYLYLFFGAKLLKNETTIIPEDGKKGR